MYICTTPHYKGRFPLDAGGVVLLGPTPKFVHDDFGKLLLPGNFPKVVECDETGTYLVEIPPVPVIVYEDTTVAEVPVSLPAATVETDDGTGDPGSEDQPLVEAQELVEEAEEPETEAAPEAPATGKKAKKGK